MEIQTERNEMADELSCRWPIFQRPLCIDRALRPGDYAHILVVGDSRDVVDCVGYVFGVDLDVAECVVWYAEFDGSASGELAKSLA